MDNIFSLFRQNPNEELTSRIISQTLNKSQPSVSNLLRKLVSQGVLMNASKYGCYKLPDKLKSKLQTLKKQVNCGD